VAVPNWKPQRQSASAQRRAKEEVRRRDGCRCRVCGRPTRVVHEHKTRGAGGRVSLENSLCVCDVGDGGLCHPLLQRDDILPVMADGAETFDASGWLDFEMTETVARKVFGDRSRPAHVRIVEDTQGA